MGAIIFIMYMNEVDIDIPDWVWYFSVSGDDRAITRSCPSVSTTPLTFV